MGHPEVLARQSSQLSVLSQSSCGCAAVALQPSKGKQTPARRYHVSSNASRIKGNSSGFSKDGRRRPSSNHAGVYVYTPFPRCYFPPNKRENAINEAGECPQKPPKPRPARKASQQEHDHLLTLSREMEKKNTDSPFSPGTQESKPTRPMTANRYTYAKSRKEAQIPRTFSTPDLSFVRKPNRVEEYLTKLEVLHALRLKLKGEDDGFKRAQKKHFPAKSASVVFDKPLGLVTPEPSKSHEFISLEGMTLKRRKRFDNKNKTHIFLA